MGFFLGGRLLGVLALLYFWFSFYLGIVLFVSLFVRVVFKMLCVCGGWGGVLINDYISFLVTK